MTDLDPAQSIKRIDLANELDFELGGLTVRPAELAILGNGDRRELQPRVMQVLVALARARPTVVSRDRLVEQCWDGRIVGDDALNRCILALRHLSQEFDSHPFDIETIPRVGHRIVENGVKQEATAQPARPKRWHFLALAAVLLAIAAGFLVWQQRGGASEPASIAVLPFRNLSDAKPFFAEGVGEEILDQLAKEPAFRVAGRATAAQLSGEPDPRKIGRALGVDYILEGSVRSAGDRVRINASLVQTKDGMRLWSESYDRKLDDILEIQAAIGKAVASGLRRSLEHSPVGREINGEAYALYLNARGLVRSQNPESGHDAIGLLRQSIRIDPNFAPAWSSLAEALQLDGRTKGNEGLIAVLPQARYAAERALKLDPSLAQAHSNLAVLLGASTPQAIVHRRRAAALQPRTSEGLMSQAWAHDASGEFMKKGASLRRARELDPLWPIPVRALLDDASAMGDRRAAEDVARRGFPDDVMAQNFGIARAASFLGDYSEAARQWSVVANSSSRWSSPAKLSLQDILFSLKLSNDHPARPPRPVIGNNRFIVRVQMTTPPSAAEWKRRNRSPDAALVYTDENLVAAKLMINAGRARELAASLDTPSGLLGIHRGDEAGVCYLQQAALVALTLRAVGRSDEADALLRRYDEVVRAGYRQGKVPTWFEDDAAAIWAAQGKTDQAVAALERALSRGWVHAGRVDLPSLEDEPAFRSLRGNRRFQALLAKHAVHFARERRETAQVLRIQTLSGD
jgi:TolB-like protein/DNA-binding winged helix-turn-helix (wHTH) protein